MDSHQVEANVVGLAATLTLDACPSLEQLVGASEGHGDPAERLEAIRHADGCASCRRVLSELCAVRTVESGSAAVPRIGRHAILGIAGSGAMGLVYKAHDPELDRMVAIKLPKLDTRDGSRFVREARAQALLSHPNIVPIHDVGIADGHAYIVMDWVDGMTLRAWLATPRSTGEILAVFEAIGRGLAAAHRSGLVHQDIKPDNVMIDRDGRAQITDFGVARKCDPIGASSVRRIEGTPVYMAPEQLLGEPGTAQTDQFSFCVSLWEALIGVRPFTGATPAALLVAISEGPRAPSTASVPRHVVACLRRGLAQEPEARFPTMEALLDALASRRRSRMLPAALAVGAIAAIGWLAIDLRDDAPAIARPNPAPHAPLDIARAAPATNPRVDAPTPAAQQPLDPARAAASAAATPRPDAARAMPHRAPTTTPHAAHRLATPPSATPPPEARARTAPSPVAPTSPSAAPTLPSAAGTSPSPTPPRVVDPPEHLDDRLIDPLAGLRGSR